MSSRDELRRRNAANEEKNKSEAETDKEDDADTLNEKLTGEGLPQASDNTTEAIDSALKGFSPRWRNYIIRGIFTLVMIFGFAFIVYLGPLALVVLIQLIQIKCYHEIINIGYFVYKSNELPWFRTLSWYFLLASNYYFYGESVIPSFGVLLHRSEFLEPLVTYHRFISFTLYTGGLVAFVLSLIKKHYLKQFTLFGWTHITLLILVTQSHFMISNIFEGLIWCLLPVSLIICNDIMAYIFGFFFGKTPLIKLSPKKTWEGFIGGGFSTILFGWILSSILVKHKFFVCPIAYSDELGGFTLDCEPGPIFRLTEYTLPKVLHILGMKTVQFYPFVLHSLSLSIFASSVGPFGGFFASGFKRAFKIKDFGDTIPGHGGFMDRFDCQVLTATFVNVYISSFVRGATPQKLLAQLFSLKHSEQLEIFNVLRERLLQLGLLHRQVAAPPLAAADG